MKKFPILLLLMAFLFMTGCAGLGQNPTPAQIESAQDWLFVQRIGYTIATRDVIGKLKGDKHDKAVAADWEVQQLFNQADADAVLGRNLDRAAIRSAVRHFITVIAGLDVPATATPITQPQ